MTSSKYTELSFLHNTEEVWIALLTIRHPTLAENVNIANNLDEIVSNGITYLGCPFDITLPSNTEEGQSGAKLRVNNVSQDLVKYVRTITTAAIVDIQIILASSPNVIEARYSGLELRQVTGDVGYIEGTLSHDNLLLETFPSHSFSPSYFSNLFT